jgi:hypothetical protein
LFDQAVAADAAFVAARRGRAIVRARLGQWAAATEDVNWCLDKEPSAGVTLYAAACVAALAADKLGDPAMAQQALTLLQQAFAQNYGRDKAATDPDLAGLRKDARFQRLLAQE